MGWYITFIDLMYHVPSLAAHQMYYPTLHHLQPILHASTIITFNAFIGTSSSLLRGGMFRLGGGFNPTPDGLVGRTREPDGVEAKPSCFEGFSFPDFEGRLPTLWDLLNKERLAEGGDWGWLVGGTPSPTENDASVGFTFFCGPPLPNNLFFFPLSLSFSLSFLFRASAIADHRGENPLLTWIPFG